MASSRPRAFAATSGLDRIAAALRIAWPAAFFSFPKCWKRSYGSAGNNQHLTSATSRTSPRRISRSICSPRSDVALISRSAQRTSEKSLFLAIAARTAVRYSASYVSPRCCFSVESSSPPFSSHISTFRRGLLITNTGNAIANLSVPGTGTRGAAHKPRVPFWPVTLGRNVRKSTISRASFSPIWSASPRIRCNSPRETCNETCLRSSISSVSIFRLSFASRSARSRMTCQAARRSRQVRPARFGSGCSRKNAR